MVASKDSIRKWVKLKDDELSQDKRGWKKGKPRKYIKQQKEESKDIRKKLEKEESFFIGAKVVHANYNITHTDSERVSKAFVDRTLKEAKMVKSPQKRERV